MIRCAVHNALCFIVSKAFAKSTVAIHILIPHSRHLCSVRCKMILSLEFASKSSLIVWLSTVKPGVKSVVHERWRILPALLYITFVLFLRHASGVQSLCFRTSLKICLIHHFLCLFVARFDVFGSDSVAVSCFSLLESVSGSLQLLYRELKNFFRLFNTSVPPFIIGCGCFTLAIFIVMRLFECLPCSTSSLLVLQLLHFSLCLQLRLFRHMFGALWLPLQLPICLLLQMFNRVHRRAQ